MNDITSGLHGYSGLKHRTRQILSLIGLFALAACGGGSGTAPADVVQTLSCDPADPATHSECGTVYIGLTDADGDFVNYTTEVVQLTLETADGRLVETLPQRTRINFTDYVDLTELLTAATVPPATYVSGTITLDYTDAEIFVEAGGDAKQAVVTDMEGNALARTELKIVLPEQDRLVVARGRPSLLQLDFDLAASHAVDILPTPARAASAAFIVAEVAPIIEKVVRVRGPLVHIDLDAGSYLVAIRPFNDTAGDFGRVTVYTTDDTEFEIDGKVFSGADGLRALADAGKGTPTVAGGTLDVAERRFTADIVFAGSSVPGIDRDAVVGNVIARNGNYLTIRGATIIPSNREAHFHDDVVVLVGENTKVFKDGDRAVDTASASLGIEAISIGQRVTIRGTKDGASETDALSPQIVFDATEGFVRMHVTHLSGIVNRVTSGQTDIALHAIDRRRADIFDFTGTGVPGGEDADPENYEIATGKLSMSDFAEGKPIVAFGFPTAFGAAPPDFTGRTVIDYADVRSALGVGWGIGGTLTPFLSTGSEGLLLNNRNPDIDVRHYIRQGPVLIDLTTLDSDTLIAPRNDGRSLFYIKSRGSLRLYSNFEEFERDLSASLAEGHAARSMHARGRYDAGTNTFSAARIGIDLLVP